MADESLRDHLVLQSKRFATHAKVRDEIMDVVHAGAATGSSPTLVDALTKGNGKKRKGEGKDPKSKDDKGKEKAGTAKPKTTVPRARTTRTATILLPNCGGGGDCELHEFCAFVGWFARYQSLVGSLVSLCLIRWLVGWLLNCLVSVFFVSFWQTMQLL